MTMFSTAARLCCTCLVPGRALRALTDLRPHYLDIIREFPQEPHISTVPVVCWECEAVMKRWTRFREQAKDSYMMLWTRTETTIHGNDKGLSDVITPRPPRLCSSNVTHTDIRPHTHNEAAVATDPLLKGGAAETIQIELGDCKEDNEDFDSNCNERAALDSIQFLQEQQALTKNEENGCTDYDAIFCSSEQEHSLDTSIPDALIKPLYKCKYCQEYFHTSAQYESHLTTHKHYNCRLCPKRFARNKALKTHTRIHRDVIRENPRIYQCNECGKKITCRNKFIAHIRTIHAGQNTFECTKCKRRYVSKYRLARHMGSHEGNRLQCSICGQKCSTQNILKFHVRTHTGEKPFECNECHKTFARKDAISSHMKVHTKVKPYQCHLCGYVSSYRTSLLQHFRTHTKPWQCVECLKRFSCNRDYRRHMRSHSGEKTKKRFQCEVCSNWFVSSTTLKHHMRIHTGEKPFMCVVCGRRFRQHTSLKIHVETHGGKKTFQCNECQETFSQKNNFIVHQRLHSGKKTYHCSQCDKHFVSSNVLSRHMRVHTGEKPFECSVCQKRFQQKSGLSTHMRTHGGKPLQCEQCLDTFPSKNRLIAHRSMHADIALHRCSVCT